MNRRSFVAGLLSLPFLRQFAPVADYRFTVNPLDYQSGAMTMNQCRKLRRARLGRVVVHCYTIDGDFLGLLRSSGFIVRGSIALREHHPGEHDVELLLEHEKFDPVPLLAEVPRYFLSFRVKDWSLVAVEKKS